MSPRTLSPAVLAKRRVAPYFLLAVLLILAWLSFRLVVIFLSDVLFALFLAYLTFPLYRRVRRRVKWPGAAAGVMLVAMTLAVVVPLGLITWQLVREGQDLAQQFQQTDPEAVTREAVARIYTAFGLPPPVDGDSGIASDVYGAVRDALSLFVRTLPARVVEALIGLLVMYYVLYYAYKDGERVLDELHEMLPLRTAHRELLFMEVGNTVRGVVYGSVLTSVMQALFAALGFWIFGVPKIVFWSVLVFVLGLLPVVGAPLVYLPWGFYLVATGDTWGGIGLILYSAVFVNGIEHLVRPILIGRVSNIHPVIVLLGVLGGVLVFGFVGLVLGPLILSVFVRILDIYRREFAPAIVEEPPRPPGEGPEPPPRTLPETGPDDAPYAAA